MPPVPAFRCLRSGVVLPLACGGVTLFGSLFFGMPMTSTHLAQMQALNRELGKLCSDPPQKAITVCRIHARLVNAL